MSVICGRQAGSLNQTANDPLNPSRTHSVQGTPGGREEGTEDRQTDQNKGKQNLHPTVTKHRAPWKHTHTHEEENVNAMDVEILFDAHTAQRNSLPH
mmetsp:Transcript_20400/g.49607  ORF Transcript_20400/g.49607 Transcript_20400/m.49607 type:complete len:97 (-) Transcript_20400:534-824(-)